MEIRLEDVWFTYDRKSYVLKNINLEFTNPGLYILIGPNGSGKTTLLKILSFILKPSKGRILVDGVDYWSINDESRRVELKKRIAYVHDKPILLRGSVEYNLKLGLKLRGDTRVDSSLVEYYIDRYMLREILGKPAGKLSAGQAKTISILRALILNPEILALDEPFTFLDASRTSLLIQDLARIASNGSIVIIATHYIHRELKIHVKQIIELINGEAASI